ncbi:acyl carrier protein [Ligilactobacillus sp. Marseille-Q7487]|jgi:acyl carrier protein|uniref:acyl carrier protein n=1 Tax=Ligilactobacillus sp. Marseille-Q7487 TaxID=3022128 RepID=UPI0015B49741|nr:acyl carrier protein [Ligilactobacillus sp. Marseille-Q7487]
MTEEQIFEKVKEIVVEQLDTEEEITMASDIKEDLDADSLDVFEIMNELEDELDVKLEANENVKTIGDVVSYVKAELDK